MITVEEARARGITLPSDEDAAQALVDETEAWLTRRIGPLDDEITETFYVGLSQGRGRLALRRYTDEVEVTDNGHLIDADRIALLDRGSTIGKVHPHDPWWTGPYVSVTYTPNDDLEVRSALYALLALAAGPESPQAAGIVAETLGDYSYELGGVAGVSAPSRRAAIVSGLLPKRDPALSVIVPSSRRVSDYDPVVNRAENDWP